MFLERVDLKTMDLTELKVKKSYITYGTENIRDSLIIPSLKVAKTYKRSVGFFSTSVFETILDGVINLARNKGSIQIIASPRLSQGDVDAIKLGYEAREAMLKTAFLRDFDQTLEELGDQKLQLAAELIAEGILDIKIVDLDRDEPEVSKEGDYHDKLGIISDAYGNSIVFVGSPNETVNGLKKNYEKVRVFVSWIPEQNEYAEEELEEFDSLWEGTNPFLRTYSFSSALNDHVLEIKENRENAKTSKAVKLRDYQKEAISAWVNNGYQGFYVMATGTGKTWTAIYSILELQKAKDCLTVICAPYKHLIKQWEEDVSKAMPDAKIIMVSSEFHDWEHKLRSTIVRQRNQPDTKIIVISTIASFNLERFGKAINKSTQPKLLVVDEAHRFTNRPDSLHEQYEYMLGLSATPFSGKSAEKGKELMRFFGGQVYDLPIEVALEKKFLVPYYYHPIYVHATDEEERNFNIKSSQIAGCFDKRGVCIDPDNLVIYLRARLRIIAMAQEKLNKIDDIILQIREKNHFIVYCGDGRLYDDNNEEGLRYINFVKRHLDSLGFKASQFTATEDMNMRMALVDSFNSGEIDALTAIRCLDEGINIPSIEGALILASNDDYREFVQRRGRILRVYGDKKYANIYDVIVLASADTPRLVEIELRRFYEYARLAINADEKLAELEDIAGSYGLDVEGLATNYDDEEYKEAPLDE